MTTITTTREFRIGVWTRLVCTKTKKQKIEENVTTEWEKERETERMNESCQIKNNAKSLTNQPTQHRLLRLFSFFFSWNAFFFEHFLWTTFTLTKLFCVSVFIFQLIVIFFLSLIFYSLAYSLLFRPPLQHQLFMICLIFSRFWYDRRRRKSEWMRKHIVYFVYLLIHFEREREREKFPFFIWSKLQMFKWKPNKNERVKHEKKKHRSFVSFNASNTIFVSSISALIRGILSEFILKMSATLWISFSLACQIIYIFSFLSRKFET